MTAFPILLKATAFTPDKLGVPLVPIKNTATTGWRVLVVRRLIDSLGSCTSRNNGSRPSLQILGRSFFRLPLNSIRIEHS
jgi:hypothetical protein